MKVERDGGAWIVVLPAECTIAEVEADADKVRLFPEGVERIEVRGGEVEEVDTAYFQLLLSIRATARQRGIPFRLSEEAEALRRMGELYGIALES